MTRDLTTGLQNVADALKDPKITGPERLELLRRQADLGDLRDTLRDRERRRAANAPTTPQR